MVREVAGTEVYTEKRKSAEDNLAATDTVVKQVWIKGCSLYSLSL